MAGQGEVAHGIGDAPGVLIAQLFDNGVVRAARLAFEVQELHDGYSVGAAVIEHV